MALFCQIAYITKTPRMDPHHRIQEVGGPTWDGSGSYWRCTLDMAIWYARERGYQYFTHNGGETALVEIQVGPSGLSYLRTVADGQRSDNLLSLPNFPAMTLLGSVVYDFPMGITVPNAGGGLLSSAPRRGLLG